MSRTGARDTYDAFASSYDDFNYRYQYERWTGRLLERARGVGLTGDRLLDVGCGTGLSLVLPMAEGWRVCGCDISPKMIDRARTRLGEDTDLRVADMRSLPRFGEFDLIWAVNDAINYLLDEEELRSAFEGMLRNLAPGGMVIFDVNTLATYRTFFATETVVEREGRRLVWRGMPPEKTGSVSGSVFEAHFEGEGAGVVSHAHRQRHFDEGEIRRAIGATGFDCVGVWGEIDGGLEPGLLDEDLHTKAVYACQKSDA